MACFSCLTHGLSPVFKTLSRAAAKSAGASLRRRGLLPARDDADARARVCLRCPMRRVYGGTAYCGTPLLRQVQRNPALEGCGCPIRDKAADPAEHCPITPSFTASTRHGPTCDCRWCAARH